MANTPTPKDQRGKPLAVVKQIDTTGPGSYRPPAKAPAQRTEKPGSGTPKGSRRWERIS